MKLFDWKLYKLYHMVKYFAVKNLGEFGKLQVIHQRFLASIELYMASYSLVYPLALVRLSHSLLTIYTTKYMISGLGV